LRQDYEYGDEKTNAQIEQEQPTYHFK